MNGALSLRNRQRIRRVNSRLLRQLTRALLAGLPCSSDFELAVYLVSAPEMCRLNEAFLRHGGTTDVITFDYGDGVQASAGGELPTPTHAGIRPADRRKATLQTAGHRDASPMLHAEIFICVDEAAAQARRFHTTWQSELVRYLVHGVLHLLGHDDVKPAARRKMKREEDRLLRALSRRFPLSKLAHKPKMTP